MADGRFVRLTVDYGERIFLILLSAPFLLAFAKALLVQVVPANAGYSELVPLGDLQKAF